MERRYGAGKIENPNGLNKEALVRLNVESRKDRKLMKDKTAEILALPVGEY